MKALWLKVKPYLKTVYAALGAAFVLLLGLWAVQRTQAARQASSKADNTAAWLEANEAATQQDLDRADIARKEAVVHAAKAEVIKARHITRLNELEGKRGANTAADLATRLSKL